MGVRLEVIQQHLLAQQDLSAVERFALLHDEGRVGSGSLYESQIPLSKVQKGQQYGFQVDLDACTGCKACVVGCNRLNGLDAGEAWRAVGVLHGGEPAAPIQQTVTAACHHCLDPACMRGCPAAAYEKDPTTGIVKHLDDQCIGCQYCTLTCPYEVPQYNKRLGIVRKCDMCQDRLADGESPACVESCPNGAISIQIVEIEEVRKAAAKDAFLPSAPHPSLTAPTTRYVTQREVPKNLVAANSHTLRAGHAHWPLAVTLVLTQLAIGAYFFDSLLSPAPESALLVAQKQCVGLIALIVAVLGLGTATLHLGRPLYAFRALLGLRTSWMSREILAGGAFANLAVAYVLCLWKPHGLELLGTSALGLELSTVTRVLGWATAAAGLAAGLCSIMIYVVTKKRWWSGPLTTTKFMGSGVVLGLATMMTATTIAHARHGGAAADPVLSRLGLFVILATLLKLLFEASTFRYQHDPSHGELKRSALLLVTELRSLSVARFALGIVGGIYLPSLLLTSPGPMKEPASIVLCGLSLVLLIAGELVERLQFFMVQSSTRMPGSIGK